MDDLINEITRQMATIDAIVEVLPDEIDSAFVSISMAVDVYAHKMGISSSRAWDWLYTVAKEVIREDGEYGEIQRK